MKKTVILSFILFFVSYLASAQSGSAILGKWQSAHGSGQIEIYKRNGLYHGKIIWLKEPNDENGKPKRDIKNPSENLRTQPIIGLEVLKDFSYKGNNMYSGGKIYDPKSGNTYNCQMSVIDGDKLNIRAYFGISLLGKTETWTRVK